jgi:transcriptional regulator with XRE-family HTH domain
VKFDPERLRSLIPRGSAKVIADSAGVSAPALSQWANGAREPGAIELAKVAKALGVSLDYFFPDLHPQIPQSLRETSRENLIDDLLAEVEELKERAFAVERLAKKIKMGKAQSPVEELRRLQGVDDIAREMGRRGIKSRDNPDIKKET